MEILLNSDDVKLSKVDGENIRRRVHRVLARFGPHIESASVYFERMSADEIRCRFSFSGPRCGVHVINVERPTPMLAMDALAAMIGIEAGRLIEGVRPMATIPREKRRSGRELPNRPNDYPEASSKNERRKAG